MRMKSKFLLFAIICFQSETSASTRSLFGEECSNTRKCDRKAWLYCYDGICDCSKKEEMFYDEAKGKCVTKSGERCIYGRDLDGEGSLFEITDCVDHSRCGKKDGICICDSDYHEVFNGTCELSKLFGDTCSNEDKCSKFLDLHCINGTCDCKEGISTYSMREGKCVGALNQTCIDRKCLDGGECKNGICVCDIDHYGDTSTNTCMVRKGVNEKCSDNSECIYKDLIKLKCTGGKCDCEEGFKYSKVQRSNYIVTRITQRRDDYYYSDRRTVENSFNHSVTGPFVELCAPLVGSSCPDRYCVTQSTCKLSDLNLDLLKYSDTVSTDLHTLFTTEAKCECDEEYLIPYKDKTRCGKIWMSGDGYSINQQERCSKNEECVNNLVCYKSKCKCPSARHQKLNSDLDYCHSKVGGPCSMNSDCIFNSFCNIITNTTIGHCHCSDGYLDNKDGECEGGPGIACDYMGDIITCDRASGLVCVDGKCSCEDEIMYTFSATQRKCVGLVGAVCQGKKSCIDNAECSELYSELELPGRCKCRDFYKETENFTCESITNVKLQFFHTAIPNSEKYL